MSRRGVHGGLSGFASKDRVRAIEYRPGVSHKLVVPTYERLRVVIKCGKNALIVHRRPRRAAGPINASSRGRGRDRPARPARPPARRVDGLPVGALAPRVPHSLVD